MHVGGTRADKRLPPSVKSKSEIKLENISQQGFSTLGFVLEKNLSWYDTIFWSKIWAVARPRVVCDKINGVAKVNERDSKSSLQYKLNGCCTHASSSAYKQLCSPALISGEKTFVGGNKCATGSDVMTKTNPFPLLEMRKTKTSAQKWEESFWRGKKQAWEKLSKHSLCQHKKYSLIDALP